tara:strand:+ start:2899 stop:3690 length:792 start_codon:yes stop_codon:yes gene_type:complete
MLTFLRKIRKSLIESGSSRKYLLYGIGEITLVVIGILIALQINNWNEKRLALIEEQKLYCTIHEEMGLSKFFQEEGGKIYADAISSSEQILMSINDPSIEITQEEINNGIHAFESRWLGGAGSVTNIYDLLISSGKLELLSSIEVIENMRSLNSHFEFLLTYEELQAQFVDNQLYPYLNARIDRISASSKQFDLDESLHVSRFKSTNELLLNDKEFANLLIDFIRHTRVLVLTYKRMGNFISKIDSIAISKCPSINSEELDVK